MATTAIAFSGMACLFIVDPRDHRPTPSVAVSRAMTWPDEIPTTTLPLPFSFEEMTSYFAEMLVHPPKVRQRDYAWFEIATRADASLSIAIMRQGSQILLLFGIKDERGMDVLRNFCKAGFFEPGESELLQNLTSAGTGIRCAVLPRFDVICEYDMGPEQTLVSLFFSPSLGFCQPSPSGS